MFNHAFRASLRWALLAPIMLAAHIADAESLRFYGYGVNDIDRVKIRIDEPADNNPGPPADIGDTDFTIEFWVRTAAGNDAGMVPCGSGEYSWISGNVVFDRDRFNQGRAFGIALADGRVVFGVSNDGGQSHTVCGTTDVRDGQWHHVAVQRQLGTGLLEVLIDGGREVSANGPTGGLSYPDDGQPLNFCGSSGGQQCLNSDPFIVLGAEKHDVGPGFPSFSGWLTELRLSTVRRYANSTYAVPTSRFSPSTAGTAALYHFDQGSGTQLIDATAGNRSPGVLRVGGGPPAGPEWSTESPFGAAPGPGQVQFSQSTYSVGEGTATLTITVSRTGGSVGEASVDYAVTGGSATQGADYELTSGMLSWGDGESTAQMFQITIIDDAQVESAETIVLALSNAVGATLGSRTSATVTINDNDSSSTPPPGGGGSSGGGGGSLGWWFLAALLGLTGHRRVETPYSRRPLRTMKVRRGARKPL